MIRILFLITALLLPSPGLSQEQAYQFPPTAVDYAQVKVPPTRDALRRVVVDKLEVFTRPIPEAAILDRLDEGAMVAIASHGAGWATMDLGGGFMGWMRLEGLRDVRDEPTASVPSVRTVVAPPVPPRRPESLLDANAQPIAKAEGRKYF